MTEEAIKLSEIFITDRTSAETDDRCGMKFWLYKKEADAGIVPKEEPLALSLGRQTHEDLALLAEMRDISPAGLSAVVDPILGALTEEDRFQQDKMELLYRRLGWFVAYGLFIEPGIRARYENVHIEKEIILDRTPLWVAVTPDRVLRNRESGKLEYREYKTSISASQKWMQSWHFAIQLHIGIAAIGEELGEKVNFAQVQALMKGDYSSVDHRLVHPYAWGYRNSKTSEWTHSYLQAKGSDWEPMPVWEYPGGLVAWVIKCGKEVAEQQFPYSPPVFLNARMLDEWVTRRTARERQVRIVTPLCRENPTLKSIYFEKRTSQCRPAFGDACPYLRVCWNATLAENPLLSEDFVKRTPHHEIEIIGAEV